MKTYTLELNDKMAFILMPQIVSYALMVPEAIPTKNKFIKDFCEGKDLNPEQVENDIISAMMNMDDEQRESIIESIRLGQEMLTDKLNEPY